MKNFLLALLSLSFLISCEQPEAIKEEKKLKVIDSYLVGTWKLMEGILIEGTDTSRTDYTKDQSFIKIINKDHFAFLLHSLPGNDSGRVFSAGGGRYELKGDQYTEHLEYCSDSSWENHDFTFTVRVTKDSLVQQGVEKLEDKGLERYNIEVYTRVKN